MIEEVTTMRNFPVFLVLLLVGCGDSGVDPLTVQHAGQPPAQLQAQHAPEITWLVLSPDAVAHMAGNGTVVVTAEIAFRDAGLDLRTLWVRMQDGTLLEFGKLPATETGTFTESFTMSTELVGVYTVEFWLVDSDGDSSNHVTAEFNVAGDVQVSDWTRRLSGPRPLYDVVWDGQVFVAVGHGGAIWTSADGIDWEAQESGIGTDLYAVESDGGDIFAVGGAAVLMSTDHGETWNAKAVPGLMGLAAVAVNASEVVAIGVGAENNFAAKIARSEDRGDTWQVNDFVAWATDLVYQNEMFVATSTNGLRRDGCGLPFTTVISSLWVAIKARSIHRWMDLTGRKF
jgi:hypothetical protein